MEITNEQLYQEIKSLRQGFKQEFKQGLDQRFERLERKWDEGLQDLKVSVIRWVVGIFIVMFILPVSVMAYFTHTLIFAAD